MTRYLPVLGVLACAVVFVPPGTRAQEPVPADVKPTCVVPPAAFQQWFGGTVKKDGMVSPASSVGFTLDPANPHCSFYQWSERMFLWLTSPTGGPGRYVFNSPIFYNVDPSSGTVTPNAAPGPNVAATPPAPLKLAVRVNKPGPRGKHLAVTRSGVVFEDATGQAGGGGTLLSQAGALVYYSTHVNDVFAAFRTGSAANAFNPPITTFPTTQPQLDQIVAFAQTLGLTLPDAAALTMEVKISWVDASTVPAGQFITTQATIPTYDFTQPAAPIPGTMVSGWMPGAPKTTTMAMVGIHVVGSVKGHPEMVWATFEHATNTPDGPYMYTNAAGGTTTVPFNPAPPPGASWLFSGNTPPFNTNPASYNIQTMKTIGLPNNGTAIQQQAAGPAAVRSITMRSFPWGVAPGAAGVNDATQIISINNSVRGQLVAGDARQNYVMIGAVWTGGQVPPSQFPTPTPVPPAAMPIGSVMLANCTMETYKQVAATPFGMNCFSCHDGNPLSGLSHIWGNMQSLPAMPKK